MHTTNLRKVGGSVMLTVPPMFLEQLHLQAGACVSLAVSDGQLVVNPKPRPRYNMAELLAVSEYANPKTKEENEWVQGAAVGGELL